MNFQRTGDLVDDKFGKIVKTDGYSEWGNYYEDASSSVNTKSMDNETVNNSTGQVAAHSNLTARFAFYGGDVTDSDPTNTGSTDGNVRHSYGAGAAKVVVKQDSSAHEVSASIDVRHYRDQGTFIGTFEYEIRAELWRIPSYLDDDSDDIYDAISNGFNYNGWQRVDAVTQSFSATGDYDQTSNFTLSHTAQQPNEESFIAVINVHSLDYPNLNGGSVTFGVTGGYLMIEGSPTYSTGDPIEKIHFLIPKGKQSDFVSGITQMFNLQYYTDPIAKKVFVEPFDYFYGKREDALNWSDKVDYSKDINEQFIDDIKSTFILKYKDAASDAFLERYNKKNYTDYGAYKEIDTTGVFQDGEYIIENKYFSPTFCLYEHQYLNDEAFSNVDNNAASIPIIHSEYTDITSTKEVERPEKEFNIGARIFLAMPVYSSTTTYSSQSFVPLSYHSFHSDGLSVITKASNDVFPTDGVVKYAFARAGFINFDCYQRSYQTAGTSPSGANVWNTSDGFVQLSIGIYNGSTVKIDPNLSFNQVKFPHSTIGTHSGNKTFDGLYKSFYSKMIQQLKSNPRVKSVFLKLKYHDVLNFDFRNIIYIEGVYYRVNKIVDYKPHLNESTRVELVEHFELGTATIGGDEMDLTEGINL